jgi:hypothetical protein
MLHYIKEDPKCHRIVPKIWIWQKDIKERGNRKKKCHLKLSMRDPCALDFCPKKKRWVKNIDNYNQTLHLFFIFSTINYQVLI